MWPVEATNKISIGWNGHKDGEPHYVRVDLGEEITKAEWLDRRAELQGKPSWESAPEWAHWLGQDKDAVWYWHGEKPEAKGEDVNGQRYWMSRGLSDIANRGVLLGDWRDTLERRPEKFKPSIEEANKLAQEFKPFTSVEDNQEQEMEQDNGWFERGELPPVGAECEAGAEGAKFEKCEIIAYHKQQVALLRSQFNGGCLDVLHMPGWSFRPIRTERDQLIEIITSKLSGTTGQVADAILAAGFKLEKK